MNPKFNITTVFALLIGFFTFFTTINGAPGDLDTTFSEDGKIFHEFGYGTNDFAHATALQSDGKLVVAGTTNYADRGVCGIARYNADGTLDTTFDGDGKKIVQVLNRFDCHTMIIQPDGKIVLAGTEGSYLVVVRLNADGSFDTSFNLDGIATTDKLTDALDIAIQADGKIVVAGGGLVRFWSDGGFDWSFNNNGRVAVEAFSVVKVAIQQDGKIVGAAYATTSPDYNVDVGIFRLNPDGSLDTTFDGDGKVATPVADSYDYVNAFTIQTDGKILVAGQSMINSQYVSMLVRYNADGSLDTKFGNGGKVIMPAAFNCKPSAVRVQPDGRIITVGYGFGASPNPDRFALAGFNSDGSLDTTFGENGIVFTGFSGLYSQAKAMALQPDGKIIAAGPGSNGGNLDFAIARYNPSGTLDTTFDGNGKTTTDVGIPSSAATAVVVQNDGKTVAVGTVSNGSIYDFAMVRYNIDGTLDPSFGNDGVVFAYFRRTYYNSTVLAAIQTDGKIVVASNTATGDNLLELMRFNPNGTPDTTFNGDGKVITAGITNVYAVAIQADGKIVAAGTIGNDAVLVRFNADGSLDSTFDGDGIVITAAPDIKTIVRSIALQADGKIIAAGSRGYNLATDTAVFRYNPDGSLDSTFDNDGIAVTPVSNKPDYAADVKIQPDGKIVVAGTSYNYTPQGSYFALVRYNPDGSLDTSFDGDGIVTTSVLSDYYNSSITGLVIQPDGRILAAGNSPVQLLYTYTRKSVLVRYNSDGSLDNSFTAATGQNYGTNGIFTYDFMNFNDLTLDPSGRAVVVGDTNGFFAVGRIQNDFGLVVGGRVVSGKSGIANVSVSLTDSIGTTHTARTNSFGYYQFKNVPLGTAAVTAASKRYTFEEPSRSINITNSISDVNFTAIE